MNFIDLSASKKIFESVPRSLQPAWASNVLSKFNDRVKPLPMQIDNLYVIVEDPTKWRQAHKQFTEIRKLVLAGVDFKFEAFLLLAELVAKITYNASGEPAPFDADSGWYIAKVAIEAASYFHDDRLKSEIELALLKYLK